MRVLCTWKHRKLYEPVQRIIKEKNVTENSAIFYYLFVIMITNKFAKAAQLAYSSGYDLNSQ
jgi:hypothetical protein